MTNLQQQLAAQKQAQHQRQSVLEAQQATAAQLADLSDHWNLNAAEAELRVEPEPAAPRQRRSFIGSRAFSKLANFDSKAASLKELAFKFENMAAAVVTSSRDTLDWQHNRRHQC